MGVLSMASGDSAVSTAAAALSLPARQRRRLLAVGLARATVVAAVLVAGYYLIPLDRLSGAWLGAAMVLGLLVLVAVSVYQVRAIIHATYPGVRAIEALASTVPLFLLLFAATYYLMSRSDAGNFSLHGLDRTEALYFTVTVFSTVGFGDITASTDAARLVVTVQMIMDLLVLGLGIRVFFGAVQYAQRDR
jgi:hypothetical protein